MQPHDPVVGPPIEAPLNDSPANTMIRFETAYEYQAYSDLKKLLTSDFQFNFSAISDPQLAAHYGTTWGKDDESQSTTNLFAASNVINMQGVAEASVIADPDVPDSLQEYYAIARVSSLELIIEFPGADAYYVDAPQDFYLVRGDRAMLDASQEAQADRWYIYRWVDKSAVPPSESPGTIHPASAAAAEHVTWGRVKATYHHLAEPAASP